MVDMGVKRTMGHEESEGPAALSLYGLVAAVRRQIWWVAGIAGLVIGFTVIFTLRQQPVYEAQTTLRVEEKRPQASAPELLAATPTRSTIETETEIIRSRSVAEDVVDSLALRITVLEPKSTRRSALFNGLRVATEAEPGTYVVQPVDDGFSLTAPDGRKVRAPSGAWLELAGIAVQPLPARPGGTGAIRRIAFTVGNRGAAADALRGALRVSRPQPNAAILSLSYQGADPTLARDVVNAVAASYIARRDAFQKQQARAAVDFLGVQVTAIGEDLRQAETALEEFRRNHFVIDPQTQAGEQVRRLAELQARREELMVQRSQLRALLDRANLPADSAGSWADFVGAPSLVASPAVGGIVQQLSTVEAERARLLSRSTPENPEVEAARVTIRILRSRLSELVASQLRGFEDAARSVDSALTRFDATLQRVPEVELQYARLRRQVDLNTQLHSLLQTRLKESEISEAMEIADIQVLDPAIVPSSPVGPRRAMNLVFGAAGGMLLGLLVALLREGVDTRVRSREEVVRLTGLPLLASIPRIAAPNGRRHRELAEQIETRLVIRHSPRSPAAEAYRALRTNVAFTSTQRGQPLRTIIVTSPEPRDGKTTTAVNLAITLAEQGHRAILISADQRRPVLHKVLHTGRTPGLSEILRGMARLDQVIRPVELPSHATGAVDFMPAGKAVPNPSELLGSPSTAALLTKLAERYDAVVMDTPPLSVVTDAAVLGRGADGVIFVARMGATHGAALRRSVEELEGIGVRIVGTVLTDVHHTEDRYGYRYGYDEYYYSGTDEEDGGQRRGRRSSK